jgi:hypothetical protein
MHIPRKPAEQIEVDWAGQTASIVDRDTGEIIPAYVFVAALSYSQYAYVEAFLSQDQESWINAHVNMNRFYGGVTRILVPDNLKTGVEKVSWYTPVINKTYHEAPQFFIIYTVLILLGAGLVLVPNLSLYSMMLLSQVLNGVLLPPILISILLLSHDEKIMEDYQNKGFYYAIAWMFTILIITLTGWLFVQLFAT